MAAADVKHTFVSAKSDGPDTTLVRPSNWNATHTLSGGAPGQAMVWDADQATKMSFGNFDHFNYVFNADMEIWGAGTTATPTGYRLVGAAATVAKDLTNKRNGNAAAALTRAGTDCYLAQDLALVWNNLGTLKGKVVSIGVWVRCATGSVARVGLHDGIGSTFSTYHTGDSTFQFLKAQHTVSASATQLELRLQIDTGNATAQFDAVIVAICGKAELAEFSPSAWQGRKCIVGLMETTAQAQSTTRFYNASSGLLATEADAEYLFPFRGVARRLFALLDAAPAAGQTLTFTMRKNAADTLLTAQVTSAGRSASDVSNEIEYLVTDTTCLKVVSSATSGSRVPHGTIEYEEIPASF